MIHIAIEVRRIAQLSIGKELILRTLQSMCVDKDPGLFYKCVSDKAPKHEILLNTALSRKQKDSNYKSLDTYF